MHQGCTLPVFDFRIVLQRLGAVGDSQLRVFQVPTESLWKVPAPKEDAVPAQRVQW